MNESTQLLKKIRSSSENLHKLKISIEQEEHKQDGEEILLTACKYTKQFHSYIVSLKKRHIADPAVDTSILIIALHEFLTYDELVEKIKFLLYSEYSINIKNSCLFFESVKLFNEFLSFTDDDRFSEYNLRLILSLLADYKELKWKKVLRNISKYSSISSRNEDFVNLLRAIENRVNFQIDLANKVKSSTLSSLFAHSKIDIIDENGTGKIKVDNEYHLEVGIETKAIFDWRFMEAEYPILFWIKPIYVNVLLRTSQNIRLLTPSYKRISLSPLTQKSSYETFSFLATEEGECYLLISYFYKNRWLKTFEFNLVAVTPELDPDSKMKPEHEPEMELV